MSSASEKRKRQKEERAARREAERKAAARRELFRRIAIAIGLGVAVAGVLLVVGALSNQPEELPEAYQAYRDHPTACEAEAPPPIEPMSFEAPEDQGLDASDEVTARLATSCGEFVISLDVAGFPVTTNSFVFLARQGFYDGTVFHRVAEDFVIQGGDPTASGEGGPGYRIPDELPDSDFIYDEGTVAMANAGRDTTGSQFFVVIGPEAEALTPSFNVLGEVVSGQDTLERIEQVPTALQPSSVEESRPLETVYLESVEIVVDS